jgi:drug/metabolite transporter (DMT)-like permease
MKAAPIRLVLSCICAVLLLASVPVVIKLVQAGPWTIAIARLLLGAICVGIYGWWRRDYRKLSRGQVTALAFMGFCFGAHWITYFYSIKLSSPSLAMVALSSYGPCLIIWGRVFLGERIYANDALAIGFALIGTLLCVPKFSFNDGLTAGFLLGVLSGMIYALLPILQKRTASYPVTLKAFGQFSFALLAFLPFLGYTDWQLGKQDWIGLLFLGIVGTFIAHSLWVSVTTQLSTIMTSVLSYAQIPVAMFLSMIFLGEVLHWQLLVGALLIVCGNIFSIIFRLRRNSVLA